MTTIVQDRVKKVWACRLFSWTEEGEDKGIKASWFADALVVGRYVEMKGLVKLEKLPLNVMNDIARRINKERHFLNFVGGVSGAVKEDWMEGYPSQRLSNYLELTFTVKEADVIKDELLFTFGNVVENTDSRSPVILFLSADQEPAGNLDHLTLRERYDQKFITLRVITDSEGRVTGLETSTPWHVSGKGETIGKPEYYFDVALKYRFEPSQTVGELLAGEALPEPITYELYGRSPEAEAGPIELQCNLKLVYWNPIRNQELPLPAEIEVQAIDYDPVGANEVLGRSKTNSYGTVQIISVNRDENGPDLYFEVLTQRKYIEYETDKLVTADQRVPSRTYFPLPQTWSSKNQWSIDGKAGYFEEFELATLGSTSDPLTFCLNLGSYFLPPVFDEDYDKYVQRWTLGLVKPLINGRSSGGLGPDVDLTEPLNEMEMMVKSLGVGDFVYLSSWFFEPLTPLQTGAYGAALDWGGLFAAKAGEGVKIRVIINDFDPISNMDQWLANNGLIPLNAIISSMPAASRDNFKYIVSLHPAHVGPLKSVFAGQGLRSIHVASHHQKFMVARRGGETFAFCGGLDIESRKVPDSWSYSGLISWHDLHVKLEGPIARDLEKNFVSRWNRDKEHSTKPALAGWKPVEELQWPPLSAMDAAPAKQKHRVQMLRTVSHNAPSGPFSNQRDDIKKMYQAAIGGASRFLYFENQYFRSRELASWVAERARQEPRLVVIMVVVASAGADDGVNKITDHGDFLQFKTFDVIRTALGPTRFRLFTMWQRAVHSKFLLVDDHWMTIGSANANTRSFDLDSELNVAILDTELVTKFRHRLWAHNLGVSEAAVSGLGITDFIPRWDAVAAANTPLKGSPFNMAGEGVLPFDYTTVPGHEQILIPDAFADLDVAPEGGLFAGLPPSGVVTYA
jgi:phosphatidylserine/phosphatidylglycerophosphate/cardiolipin synthase-like enzyme